MVISLDRKSELLKIRCYLYQ